MSSSSEFSANKTLKILDITMLAYAALAVLGAGLVLVFFQETIQNLIPVLLMLVFLSGTWYIHLKIRDRKIDRIVILGWILISVICLAIGLLVIFFFPFS
ncbi:MAG: hypothetical protein ACFFCZ_31285 [Promethearchaeota archaeon]